MPPDEGDLERLERERQDADRRYNEALTAFDAALLRSAPLPGAAVAAASSWIGIMRHAPSCRRRYLSVWLRRLATDRMTRGRSSAPAEEAPLVIAEKVKSALRLAFQAVQLTLQGAANRPLSVTNQFPSADR